MISRFRQLLSLLLAAGIALNSVSGQDAPSQRRAKVITFAPGENVNELYIGIMGEVVNPGTYQLDAASLKLQTIVQRAGGLTPDATTAIRVVRQGRVSHREIYSERANSTLFPGDLLIVDSSVSPFLNDGDMRGDRTD